MRRLSTRAFGMRRPPPWRIFEGPEVGARRPEPQVPAAYGTTRGTKQQVNSHTQNDPKAQNRYSLFTHNAPRRARHVLAR